MSVTLNATSGAVVYSPDIITCAQVLAADQVNATATLATVPTFTIPLGLGDRILANYFVHYNIAGAATADLTFRVYTVDQTTPATGVTPQFLRVVGEAFQAGEANDVTTISTADATTTITAAAIGNGLLSVRANVLNNATTLSNLIFQFAPASIAGSGTNTVYAGSYVEYRRF